MKVHAAVQHGLPAIAIAVVVSMLVPSQTGDPVIDYVGLAVPIIGEFLNFMQQILVPVGAALGEYVIAPVVAVIPREAEGGFAIYFMIFAGLLLVSLIMNVLWRPLGYTRRKDEEKKRKKQKSKED